MKYNYIILFFTLLLLTACVDNSKEKDDFFIEIHDEKLRNILNDFASNCGAGDRPIRVEVMITSFSYDEMELVLTVVSSSTNSFLNIPAPIASYATVINGRLFMIYSGVDILKNGMYQKDHLNLPKRNGNDSLRLTVKSKVLPYLSNINHPTFSGGKYNCFPTLVKIQGDKVTITPKVENPFFKRPKPSVRFVPPQ